MKASNSPHHQIIEARLIPHIESAEGAAIILWEQLAAQLISIMGEGGFHSLYARSVYLASLTFPWLIAHKDSSPADYLANLKINFAGHPIAEVNAANRLLLITFTDILISLIGEELTVSILCLAWGHDVPQCADKEFNNE